MRNRLYSLCWLNDGVHWLLLSANGQVLLVSQIAFATEQEALKDLLGVL